jgi:hypothetical protein
MAERYVVVRYCTVRVGGTTSARAHTHTRVRERPGFERGYDGTYGVGGSVRD